MDDFERGSQIEVKIADNHSGLSSSCTDEELGDTTMLQGGGSDSHARSSDGQSGSLRFSK